MGALSARLIRRQLEPLARLVEGTRRLAQRDFDTPVAIAGNDEFALLGASFNRMADGLRRQFGALETLADIDRLLLRSPGLEPILDTVLPRIAEVLGCRSVSVLLIDPDADDHARAYDHRRDEGRHAAVRRIAADVTALRALLDGTPGISVSAAELRAAPVISASGDSQSQHFRLCALRHDERLSGFLCIGFDAEPGAEAATPVRADDFADRLSVVLTNLERTDRLYEQANFDPLTGLANRQMFRDELGTRLADPRANGALLYIDLDHFKNVNDSGGHSVGDELLCVVARRLQGCVETGDMVARLGGDEFAVVTAGSVDGGAARTMAQRLLLAVREPLLLSGREYRVEASIGITLFPGDGRSIETLLKCSDIAMYRAKESGRGQAVFFEPAMQERMEARARLESGLYRTLERGEFALHYQPIVDVGGGEAHGVEALLRWPRSDGGSSYSPAAFVPVAEESGLIVAIGAWVLRSACTQFAQWRAQGAPVRFVSVNVSVRQLRDAGLYEQVVATLTRCGMQPGELHLEITEGVLADGERVAANLARLAELGVHLALDDFGTGFSSLSYLRRFPIHSVKIDRSFITGIPQEVGACRLAESIIAMSSAIEKQVVAEGVETEEQMRFLQSAGCHFIQGFLLGRPMEATDIPGFLQRLERLRASASDPELEETARMRRAELSPRKKKKSSAAS
ncbi:MAG: EAL domain-containing protein [Steroidobacteraceae bacterium]